MAQAIPIVLAAGATLLQAGGTIIGANAEARELRNQATQLEARAGLERASSQRQSIEQRRQATLAGSRALTLAAASGAGADDPSVLNAIAGIDGDGEYRALSSLYSGDQTALGLEADAASKRRGAKTTWTLGLMRAGSTILSDGSSLYGRFGKAPPKLDLSGTTEFAPKMDLPAKLDTRILKA